MDKETILHNILTAFLFCLTFSMFFARLFIAIASTTGITMDHPNTNPRRIHKKPVPRIGGFSLLLSFVCTAILVMPSDLWLNQQIQGFILGAVLVTIVGSIDDIKEIGGKVKLFFEIVIVSFIVSEFRIVIPYINNPFGGIIEFFPWLSFLLSVIWILGIMNTINFIDGIDGLATSVVIVFLVIVGCVSVLFSQMPLLLLLIMVCGCCVGFLFFNWHPAKTFLGDGGTMFLGFCIGVLSILTGAKLATAMLVLMLPVIDTIYAFSLRISSRKSLFTADRNHLHYRLLKKGLSIPKSTVLISVVSFFFGLAALPSTTLIKVVALILSAMLSVCIVLWSTKE